VNIMGQLIRVQKRRRTDDTDKETPVFWGGVACRYDVKAVIPQKRRTRRTFRRELRF
jgi:hypothetical protein